MRKLYIILLSIAVILQSSHLLFDLSGLRADIFLFYDYPGNGRLLSNILFETNMYFMAWTFIFILWHKTRNKIYFAFFVWWSYNFLTYYLFFGQKTNIIGIPLLLILLIWAKLKR